MNHACEELVPDAAEFGNIILRMLLWKHKYCIYIPNDLFLPFWQRFKHQAFVRILKDPHFYFNVIQGNPNLPFDSQTVASLINTNILYIERLKISSPVSFPRYEMFVFYCKPADCVTVQNNVVTSFFLKYCDCYFLRGSNIFQKVKHEFGKEKLFWVVRCTKQVIIFALEARKQQYGARENAYNRRRHVVLLCAIYCHSCS